MLHRDSAEAYARDDRDGDDPRGDPVDDQAERRPPPRGGHKLASVLPEILESVADKADDDKPDGHGYGEGRDDDEDGGDEALDGDHLRPAVSNREADVDPGYEHQSER